MSLLTYEDARPWARSIKTRVTKREMPPWNLDPTVGIKEILDDPSLSDAEIQTIAKWVDVGAPKGEMADMPKAPTFPSLDEWSIGEPDFVISAPEWTQPAQGADWFGDFYVDSGLTEDRWIKAIEVLPTVKGRKAVHHTIVYAFQDDKELLNEMLPVRTPDGFNANNGTRLAEYTIGNNGDVYADGTARLIKAGARIHFNAHYHSIGEEVKDRIRVGMKFYPRGYTPKYVLMNKLLSASGYIDLPAGASNVQQRRLLPAAEADQADALPAAHALARQVDAARGDLSGRARRADFLGAALRQQLADHLRLQEPAGVPGGHRAASDELPRQLVGQQEQPGSDQLGRRRRAHGRRDVDRAHRFHLPERRRLPGRHQEAAGVDESATAVSRRSTLEGTVGVTVPYLISGSRSATLRPPARQTAITFTAPQRLTSELAEHPTR